MANRPESTPIHEEIHMYTKLASARGWSLLGAATVVCTMFTGNVAAKDHDVTVAIHVSARDSI